MRLSNHRFRRVNRIELSMTSMIDVVFLLLIFFLVTTTFVRPERQIVSAIQSNERQSAKKENHLEPALVDVERLGSDIVFKLGAIRTNDIAEIKNVLLGFENKSEGAYVRVADDVPFESAAQAIAVCRAAGFTAVAYLPKE